jgi:nucleoid DNA-binding protein
MNKRDLIEAVAKELNMSKREAASVVELVFGIIKDCLKRYEDINIGGFGEFMMKKRKARRGVNPKTGEKIEIAASTAPKFRASKTLKAFIE